MNESTEISLGLTSEDIEKVALVSASIKSTYTRKKIKKVSLTQLINRLFLLFQENVVFLIYKKVADKNRLIFYTYRDVLYDEDFLKLLSLTHEEYYSSKDSKTDNVITERFFSKEKTSLNFPEASHIENKCIIDKGVGNYSILIIEKNYLIERKFTPAKKGDYKYLMLDMLWRRLFEASEYSKEIGIPRRITKSLDLLSSSPMENNRGQEYLEVTPFDLKKISYKNFPDEEEFLESQKKIIKSIVDSVYESVSQSALIDNKGAKPANIIFLLKFFGGEGTINRNEVTHELEGGKKRRECYPYSLQLVVPQNQRKDFKIVLRKISEDNISILKDNTLKWKYTQVLSKEYLGNDLNLETREQHNDRYSNLEVDKQLWENYLLKNKHSEILSTMTEPVTGRGIADESLVSGFATLIKKPYVEGGKERVPSKELDKNIESEQVRRDISLYYILSTMVGDSSINEIDVFTVPIKVGNCTYMSIGHVVLNSNDNWFRNYHFYNDIVRHCVRRIRYQTRSRYLVEVQEQTKISFSVAVSKRKKDDSIRLQDEFENQLYNRMHCMCRVWPYSFIHINVESNETSIAGVNDLPILDGAYFLSFKAEPNPFYRKDPAPYYDGGAEHKFLTDEHIKISLDRAVKEINALVYFEELG